MKLKVLAFSMLFTSIQAFSQSAQPEQKQNPIGYDRALVTIKGLDRQGNTEVLLAKVVEATTAEEVYAYADWLKTKILTTETRDPLYFWAYAHLLRIINISDTSALAYATGLLLLETEINRCADPTTTKGKQYRAWMLQSELRQNYWDQTVEIRRKALQFALAHEELKRHSPPINWVCDGGMEQMIAALKQSESRQPNESLPKINGVQVLPIAATPHRLVSDQEFETARASIRQSFTARFSGEKETDKNP